MEPSKLTSLLPQLCKDVWSIADDIKHLTEHFDADKDGLISGEDFARAFETIPQDQLLSEVRRYKLPVSAAHSAAPVEQRRR